MRPLCSCAATSQRHNFLSTFPTNRRVNWKKNRKKKNVYLINRYKPPEAPTLNLIVCQHRRHAFKLPVPVRALDSLSPSIWSGVSLRFLILMRHWGTHIMQLIKRQSMNEWTLRLEVESEIMATQCQEKELCVTICAHAQPNGRVKYFIFMQIFSLILCVRHSSVFANKNWLHLLCLYPIPILFCEYLSFSVLFSFVHSAHSICSGQMRDADTLKRVSTDRYVWM